MVGRFRRLLPVVSALCVLVAGIAAGAEEPALSRAQTLLFDTNHLDHLEAVGPGQRLHYTFVRQGGAEPGFEDGVTETVTGAGPKAARTCPSSSSAATGRSTSRRSRASPATPC